MNIGFAAGAGITLGLLFYGGLWWTVRTLLTTRHTVAVSMLSYLFRLTVTLGAFVLIARGGWQGVLACLAGFVAGKFIVSRVFPVCT